MQKQVEIIQEQDKLPSPRVDTSLHENWLSIGLNFDPEGPASNIRSKGETNLKQIRTSIYRQDDDDILEDIR
jgi:hypothetical protein